MEANEEETERRRATSALYKYAGLYLFIYF